jgi:hypothetical protein
MGVKLSHIKGSTYSYIVDVSKQGAEENVST